MLPKLIMQYPFSVLCGNTVRITYDARNVIANIEGFRRSSEVGRDIYGNIPSRKLCICYFALIGTFSRRESEVPSKVIRGGKKFIKNISLCVFFCTHMYTLAKVCF